MKTFHKLFEKVIKHEGYYANVTGDRGGETYMGIARNLHPQWEGWTFIDAYKETQGTIKHNEKINDLELTNLVKEFYKHTFYNNYNIAGINNYAIQEITFDWCVNSGHWGSRNIQRMLNKSFNAYLTIDGIIGSQTLTVINQCNPSSLFAAIKRARIAYYHTIAKKGQNHKFLKGWLKRCESFEFKTN